MRDSQSGPRMVHTRQRRRALVALAAISLSLLAACGDDKKDTTQPGSVTTGARQTVALAFVGARTGDNANLGINIYNGAVLGDWCDSGRLAGWFEAGSVIPTV